VFPHVPTLPPGRSTPSHTLAPAARAWWRRVPPESTLLCDSSVLSRQSLRRPGDGVSGLRDLPGPTPPIKSASSGRDGRAPDRHRTPSSSTRPTGARHPALGLDARPLGSRDGFHGRHGPVVASVYAPRSLHPACGRTTIVGTAAGSRTHRAPSDPSRLAKKPDSNSSSSARSPNGASRCSWPTSWPTTPGSPHEPP
jgi:hypothetical protein